MTVVKSSLSTLWPYILCGAFVAFLWKFDLTPYVPYTGPELMLARSIIYALLCAPVLYFSFEGISSPRRKIQPLLLSIVILSVLGSVSYLFMEGLPYIQNQKPFFAMRYVSWLMEISAIFFLPALVAALMVLIGIKKTLLKSATKQVEDEPYGSARLCSAQEAISQNDKKGLPIGRILSSIKGDDINLIEKIKSSKSGEIFRYDPIHSFLIAPTGSGKGVGFVIPTLLDYDGPVVCIDPKRAENFTVTARHRSQSGNRKIYAFDTCELTGQETAQINIFDFLKSDDKKFLDNIKMYVSGLCPCTGDSREDFFIEAAQDILCCVFLMASTLPENERNLVSVSDLLMQTNEELEDFFKSLEDDTKTCDGVMSRLAKKILSTDQRELSGCMNTARKSLKFLESGPYRNICCKTTLSVDDIFNNRADLFFCIPSTEIRSHGHGFIRLVLSVLIQQIKLLEVPPKQSVLFLLDEMAGVGRIDVVNDILLEGRGFGISLMGVAQTVSSLKEIYRHEIDTMLSSSLVSFLGTQTPDDLKYISRKLGQKTVFTESDSVNGTESKKNEGHTKSAVSRPLLNEREIRKLGDDFVVSFPKDMDPFVLKRLNYLNDKNYKGKFEENHFHKCG